MSQALSFHSVRRQIIQELDISHLTKEEQHDVINALGEVLLERATYEVMSLVPEDVLKELDALAVAKDYAAIQEKIRATVPNIDEVVKQAVHEGIREHVRLVKEEVSKRLSHDTHTAHRA
jgi:hypothetical protein